MPECWLPVVGYEGLYDVSDLGRIWSRQRWRGSVGRLLPGNIDAHGYLRVWLSGRGKRRYRLVHQLVLEAFVGPRPPGEEGRHGRAGGGQTDNRLLNLEWGTRAENVADQRRDGTAARGERNGHAKLSSAQVVQIRLRAAQERQADLAREFGVSRTTICQIVKGQRWQ